MLKGDKAYPNFEDPPVVEVVFGVQFHDIASLLAPHFGLFWETIRAEYPKIEEKPPLAPRIEAPDGGEVELTAEFVDTPPLPRIWFISSDDSYIIQLQRDRFHHNWRAGRQGFKYPRFEVLHPAFLEQFARFNAFLDKEKLGKPKLRQLELTYVNHVQFDYLESCLSTVLPDLAWQAKEKRFLSRPTTLSWRASFELPRSMGRLHVTVSTAKTMPSREPILALELTARGINDDWQDWFKVAREYIVCGFEDLTSEEARKERWKQL